MRPGMGLNNSKQVAQSIFHFLLSFIFMTITTTMILLGCFFNRFFVYVFFYCLLYHFSLFAKS
uniref:Uncharacterized protein n=1 Tax=Lepeophtheirus salmonis TaxID=72036 RepID=A0A0K2TXL2_LEPSM